MCAHLGRGTVFIQRTIWAGLPPGKNIVPQLWGEKGYVYWVIVQESSDDGVAVTRFVASWRKNQTHQHRHRRKQNWRGCPKEQHANAFLRLRFEREMYLRESAMPDGDDRGSLQNIVRQPYRYGFQDSAYRTGKGNLRVHWWFKRYI